MSRVRILLKRPKDEVGHHRAVVCEVDHILTRGGEAKFWTFRPEVANGLAAPPHYQALILCAGRMNKTIPILILGTAIIASPQPHRVLADPQMSATEQWQLTQACADLGKKKIEESNERDVHPPQFDHSVETRYDPAARRCYVELISRSRDAPNNGFGQQNHDLYDGQTDELLAFVTFSNEGYLVAGRVFDQNYENAPTPRSIQEEYPNKPFSQFYQFYYNALSEDGLDYINERMGREKVHEWCKAAEGDPRGGPAVECRP
jgi:hypothetical protein